MALSHSTALRNAILGTGFKSAFDTTGRLLLYSGSPPSTADLAPTGTLLGTITLSGTAFSAASGASIALAGTPLTTTAAATGTVGYFRFQLSGDAGTTNTTDKRLQGTVTATGGGGDMTIDNAALVSGGTVNLASFSYTAAP